ncbi:hypothetical protein GHT06_011878 [Daphnia sinensis]|uniref:Uncharacterized protein n=1 Tax=Daphnia sinensis TaxID=1820382 RepID=A0AAD5KUV2_9CRUS|nr:hypothetical protein GHT06_011878 [Daphnia sinensis]
MERISIIQGAPMIKETINTLMTTSTHVTSRPTCFLINDCLEYRKNNARLSKFYSCEPQ